MQRRTIAAAIAAVAAAITGISITQCTGATETKTKAPTTKGPHCIKGCPCGEACIDCSLTCHEKKPTCTKGCACGDACIDCSLACRH